MIASDKTTCYLDLPWQEGAMDIALGEAKKAYREGEVPVGAALYWDGELIASAHNLRETNADPFAHAECMVIKEASKQLGVWRLSKAAMVVTLEPCLMCMGAMIAARIPVVVYGADDPKAGAAGTLYDLSDDPRLNHKIKVVRGIRQKEAADLLVRFFSKRRS